MENIKSKILNIDNLVMGTIDDNYIPKDSLYKIPNNQRSYEWTYHELNDFLEDLTAVYLNEKEEYFMGNIILDFEEKNSQFYFNIQDGQQRITTIFIYFAALRKFLTVLKTYYLNDSRSENGDTALDNMYEKIIELDMLCTNVLLFRSGAKFKIISGIFDKFLQTILSFSWGNESDFCYEDELIFNISYNLDCNKIGSLVEEENINIKYVEINIKNAFIFFYNKFLISWKDYSVDKESPTLSTLNIFSTNLGLDIYFFSKYLYNHVIFNVLKLSSIFSKKRFKIFETTNSRGTTLKESDKIKNLILSKLYDESEEKALAALEIWSQIILLTDTKIEEFIKNMVTIEANILYNKTKKISKKNVYDEFVKISKMNNINYLEMLKQWKRFSGYFDKILNPNVNIKQGADYFNSREILKTEFIISRPFQLLMYNYSVEDKTFVSQIKDLVTIYILAISLQVNDKYRKASSLEEKLFALMHVYNIFSFERIKSDNFSKVIHDLYDELKNKSSVKSNELYLTKDTLKDRVKTISAASSEKITKYILIKFENSFRSTSIPMRINYETNYQLEHILPKEPKSSSAEYNFKFSKEFNNILESLGNYLILSSKVNKLCSNKSITDKISIYPDDKELFIVRDFLEYIEKNEFKPENIKNDIKKRTNYLSDKLVNSHIFDLETTF